MPPRLIWVPGHGDRARAVDLMKNNDKRRGRIEAMRSLLDRCAYPTKGYAVVGKPHPLIVGATDTLLEAGEEPTDLSPTPLAGLHGGPGLHPDQD